MFDIVVDIRTHLRFQYCSEETRIHCKLFFTVLFIANNNFAVRIFWYCSLIVY